MFCWCPLHGKGISNIRFRCGEKGFSMLEQNTRLVKQVGVKILGCDVASSPSGPPSGSIIPVQQNYYGVGNTTK